MAHGLVYHPTQGSRVIKKKKRTFPTPTVPAPTLGVESVLAMKFTTQHDLH